jgi:uncharacterized protein YbcI
VHSTSTPDDDPAIASPPVVSVAASLHLVDPSAYCGVVMPGVTAHRIRSDLESQISRSMIHFEKEFMGRGPLETQTYLLDDIILVRLKGVLTPAEQKLAKSKSARSSYLLKQVRNELMSSYRSMLEGLLKDVVDVRVRSIHTDISTKTGERVIVFTLLDKLDLGDCRCGRSEERRQIGDRPASNPPEERNRSEAD